MLNSVRFSLASPQWVSAMSIAFVITVEPGFLEAQALLLVESIRTWAGPYREEAVVLVQPRSGRTMCEGTRARFERMGASFHHQTLNERLADTPMANPVYVGAWAEQNLSVDCIALCDADSVILNPPEAFELQANALVAVQAVRRKGRGSSGADDPADPNWMDMYRVCGVKPHREVTCMQNGRRIRAYWNGGLVVARRSSGLFSTWLAFVERVADFNRQTGRDLVALDQKVLAPAVDAAAANGVVELPMEYNYAIPQRGIMVRDDMRTVSLEDLVHVHYHHWFNRRHFLTDLRPEFDTSGERFKWLSERLPLAPVHSQPLLSEESRSAAIKPSRYRSRFKEARSAYHRYTG